MSIEKRAITDPGTFQPPDGFDEYRLLGPLGAGRMGVVYLAQDELLERHVAVKFIPTIDDDALARFLVEARAAARLQHPNVATLYRVGQLDDRPYLIYEFVRGTTLDKLPRPVDPAEVLRIAIDLTRGLAAAHRRGVLHRDIKPGNAILADTGEAKLLDFGVAKLVETAVGATARPDKDARDSRPHLETLADGTPMPKRVADGTKKLSADDEDALADLTGGQLLGTPYFMSPEAWRRQASERSDLFSLGILLYELLAGKGPFRDVPLPELPRAVLERDARPLRSVAPAVPEALAAVVDRCVKRNPDERFASADHLLAALESLRPARAGARVPEGNPYRGLRPFEPEHRAVFFGRSRALAQALDRLRVERFLLVTGDSGVGKSSICAAGILPIASEGGLEDGRQWSVARIVPGRHPVLALAGALAPVLGGERASGAGADDLEAAIRDEPAALGRLIRKHQPEHDGVLVYVDQLEELVTLADAAEAAAVSEAIAVLAGGLPGVRVLATARSDFLSRLEGLSGFTGRVSRALFLLGPLGRDEIREAVVGPAAVKHVKFESDDTVEHLVDSTIAAQGGMPLLQFALAELWERRDLDKAVIPASALAELGGVSGALSRHADALIAALLPAERVAARAVMLRLVTVDRTRARRVEDELVLSPQHRAALDALVRGRLVVAGDSVDGATYEIAHEALVEGWGTLSTWLAEAAESRALHHRLETAAAEWRKKHHRRDLLWGARQLLEASALPADELTPREKEFLDASRRGNRRIVWLRRAIAIGVVLVAIGVYVGTRIQAAMQRDDAIAADLALAHQRLAHARELDAAVVALRDQAFGLYDAGNVAAGEAAWTDAVARRGELVTAWREASQPIERALLLDNSRGDVRRAYAETLYDRAIIAEREHQPTDDLLSRLAVYDADGSLRVRWSAPARLEVATTPPGADLVARPIAAAGTPRTLGAPIHLGTAPLAGASLPPGAYMIEATLAGGGRVAQAIALTRGQAEHLAITISAPGAVPDGFVYIPAGASPFGSADDESVRTFFHAVPMHTVETDAFLIAKTETTYASWIEFLESLPDAERAQRTPNSTEAGAEEGAVELRRVAPQKWELHIGSAKAELDQKISYSATHPAWDWIQLPVTGVSFEDAVAYTQWLARTGKVPGARLCTEREWERAARGADDRFFPHGDALRAEQANIDSTYDAALGPDAVGAHPASRSPYGLDDMAGNVWELVINEQTADLANARGGSFSYAASTARIANRESPPKTYREISLGLRICAWPQFR